MAQIVVSASPVALSAALEGKRSVTVEAEYGDVVVEGSLLTLAHHGSRSGNPVPCTRENALVEGVEVVGLSHVDLDALGGVLSVCGRKPGPAGFWALAAHVDVNGSHKAQDHEAWAAHHLELQAYHAWSSTRRVQVPREGVLDVTEIADEGCKVLEAIFGGDAVLLAQGETWASGTRDAEAAAWIEDIVVLDRAVRVFAGLVFGSAWYRMKSGQVADAVVWYNTRTGEINLSFEAGDNSPVSAVEVMQTLFGPLAGGRRGIAGGPRGVRLGLDGLVRVVGEVTARFII